MDVSSDVGPHKLLDFACFVCSKAPAGEPGNATASCMLQMKLQENPKFSGDEPSVSDVTLEMNPGTLDSLLEGMGRIRDQLSVVANRKQ